MRPSQDFEVKPVSHKVSAVSVLGYTTLGRMVHKIGKKRNCLSLKIDLFTYFEPI